MVTLSPLETEKEAEFFQAHLDYLTELRAYGTVFASGRLIDGPPGGIVIYKAKNLKAARMLVEIDPFIIEKIRSYTIYEWAVNF